MNTDKIFSTHPPIDYIPGWLSKDEANSLLSELLQQVAWKTEKIKIFGKHIVVPRKVAWFGENGAVYRYGGLIHCPLPWILPLKLLKEKLKQEYKFEANSVLCNLYKNGRDYMGWHRDNESSLGKSPIIASVSLGPSRKFMFRHIYSKKTHSLLLDSGSLLLMKGGCQQEWQHCLPKMAQVEEPRINLTFRKIIY